MTVSLHRYNRVAMALHWVTAVLMIYMLFWGEDLVHRPGGQQGANPALHASLGITILILSVARLAWRFVKPPPADVPMPKWQAAAGHTLHWLFYALLILMPLSGMAAWDHGLTGRHPEYAGLTYFGLFPIPHYPLEWFGNLHKVMALVGKFLVGLHILAALKHQFYDRDRVIERMLPGKSAN